MAFTYTVDEFLESVKVRCLVPISQLTFEDEDILRFANEEIELKLLPHILRVKEEFYVTKELSDLVSGTTRYPIPYRAISSKIRLLQYADGDYVYPLTRIPLENVPYYQYGSSNIEEAAFYVEGNDVVLLTDPTRTGQLSFSIYLKPNKLVTSERVGIISSIDRSGDGTNGSVTLSNSTFPTNFTAGTLVDFLEAKPNFRTYSYDIAVVSINSTTKQIFLPIANIPTNLKVGDHIANAGECITPQIPAELQSMLAQSVACRLLEAMGDKNNLTLAMAKLKEMTDNVFILIDTRTEGNPQKIANINGLMVRSKIGSRKLRGYKP